MINLKNAGGLLVDDTGKATKHQKKLLKAFDYNVLEQCVSHSPFNRARWFVPLTRSQNLYNDCDRYDSFLAAGKPQIQLEYLAAYTECPVLKPGQKFLSYSGTNINSSQIILSCNQ